MTPAARGSSRARRVCRGLVSAAGRVTFVLIVLVSLALPRGDRLRLTSVDAAAVGHRYGLVSWEFAHFPAKWLHRVYTALPWTDTSTTRRRAELDEYIKLVKEIRAAQGRLDEASSRGQSATEGAGAPQAELDELYARRNRIRNGIEEYLEAVISHVLVEQGLNAAGGFVWPPVDFRLDETPNVLVTSPRDRIERLETALIEPAIPVEAMDAIEQELLDSRNLSAIVERTGGVATYPTVITSDRDLLPLLEVAAHEWLHSHLFFHGLGQSYESSSDLRTLNETLADMAGREIGGIAYSKITGDPAPPLGPPRSPAPPAPGEFDFFSFMRETRLRTDELLDAGDIAAAEKYMEERRVELNGHGYRVRKINQAYFAFHGSYGESPSSVSPIAHELYELRTRSKDAGEFVRAVRGVRSYEQFKVILAARLARETLGAPHARLARHAAVAGFSPADHAILSGLSPRGSQGGASRALRRGHIRALPRGLRRLMQPAPEQSGATRNSTSEVQLRPERWRQAGRDVPAAAA